MKNRVWRIGTRGSPLALTQAEETRSRLMQAHDLAADCLEIVVLSTQGDQIQDRPLAEVGGKGLFTKEIDTALIERKIDIAVHSMKDVATTPPEAVCFQAILPREDVRDAFFSQKATDLDSLPEGAVIGTASLRRQAQVKHYRPDLRTTLLRGNVQTRMRRLAEGKIDATFLAMAGLNRLGLADQAQAIIAPHVMLPAAAQGAIGIAAHCEDTEAEALLQPLNCPETALCITAERAFLGRLDGSCRTPIAALAEIEQDQLCFRGEILAPDGSQRFATASCCATNEEAAKAMGIAAAQELIAQSGQEFWEAVRRAAL